MSGRQLLVGLFVAVLVVQSATVLAVQPVTAATYPDADAACQGTGDGQRLVGILPGSSTATDEQVLQGNESLYSGTTLRLALCEDGTVLNTYGSEWEVSDSPGLDVLETTDATVTVRVTGENQEIDVLGLVDRKDGIPAVFIKVEDIPTADSELANATIPFDTKKAADRYAKNESAYLEAVSNLTATAESLNESAAAVESGDLNPNTTTTNESLVAIKESRASVTESRRTLEAQLYGTAWRARGETTALTALDAAQARERAAKAKSESAMRNYLTTLETAESDARSTALLNLGGAVLVGLVVGLVPGWKLTASKLERIRRDREVNSRVSYSPRVLARAVGLAVVVLVLTLAALFGLGDPGTLGGLL